MSEENCKKIGKIQSVTYGFSGYQGQMFGISFTLGSEKDGWGVGDFWGFWGANIEHSDNCKWTKEERVKFHGDNTMRISKLMIDAKVDDVADLKGVPIEITFEGPNHWGSKLKEWRILTEVL